MIGAVFAFIVVFIVLAAIFFALFELSPFAHHSDVYHRPGERQESPHLE